MSAKDALDRYYTRSEVAVASVRALEVHGVGIGSSTIEPSVGDGTFLHALEDATGVKPWACDIDPEAAGLHEAARVWVGDWRIAASGLVAAGVSFDAAVGNPPFGGPAAGRGRNPGDPPYLGLHHALAAMEVAPVVAFILPWSWLATPLAMAQLKGRDPSIVYRYQSRPFSDLRELAFWVWDGEPGRTRIGPFIDWRVS